MLNETIEDVEQAEIADHPPRTDAFNSLWDKRLI